MGSHRAKQGHRNTRMYTNITTYSCYLPVLGQELQSTVSPCKMQMDRETVKEQILIQFPQVDNVQAAVDF